tara:strand:- start:10562 stop:10783 length:222 start_codon:yes stop_codon:yes gene_type:complete
MGKVKLTIFVGILLAILLLAIKVEVVEVGLDEPGYTYIGSALTGVLRVNAENGTTAPCMIGENKKAYCLNWIK